MKREEADLDFLPAVRVGRERRKKEASSLRLAQWREGVRSKLPNRTQGLAGTARSLDLLQTRK